MTMRRTTALIGLLTLVAVMSGAATAAADEAIEGVWHSEHFLSDIRVEQTSAAHFSGISLLGAFAPPCTVKNGDEIWGIDTFQGTYRGTAEFYDTNSDACPHAPGQALFGVTPGGLLRVCVQDPFGSNPQNYPDFDTSSSLPFGGPCYDNQRVATRSQMVKVLSNSTYIQQIKPAKCHKADLVHHVEVRSPVTDPVRKTVITINGHKPDVLSSIKHATGERTIKVTVTTALNKLRTRSRTFAACHA
jgi:hypothetical protein